MEAEGDGELRCLGYATTDGAVAHCSREEFAGDLTFNPSVQAYSHFLRGHCWCGARHGGQPEPRLEWSTLGDISETNGLDAGGEASPDGIFSRRGRGS